jgi:hypothetical protein
LNILEQSRYPGKKSGNFWHSVSMDSLGTGNLGVLELWYFGVMELCSNFSPCCPGWKPKILSRFETWGPCEIVGLNALLCPPTLESWNLAWSPSLLAPRHCNLGTFKPCNLGTFDPEPWNLLPCSVTLQPWNRATLES